MARGCTRSSSIRTSHSRSHSHSHGRTQKIKNQGRIFQKQIDAIANTTTAPSLVNGILTIKGSQASVINHLNIRIASPDAIMYTPQLPMYPPPDMYQPSPLSMYQPPMEMMAMCPPPPIVVQQPHVIEGNITVVGSKTASSGTCIFNLIVFFGSLLLFPLLFLCCMCVKSVIYPKYDLSADFYKLLGPFLRKQMQCRVLKLNIVDSGFDITKAKDLYQSLRGTQLTGLTLVNKALECNYIGTEADDFKSNVACLKSLPFTSTFTWGDMVL